MHSLGNSKERDVSSTTSETLLGKLRLNPHDDEAWEGFILRYGSKIQQWCRRRKLQQADAEDVTQNVLARIVTAIQQFEYDPARTFRGWLRTITENAISDYQSRRQVHERGSGDDNVREMLSSLEAREDLLQRLEEEFDQELLEIAIEKVRVDVYPIYWQAYQLRIVDCWTPAEVADRLNIAVPTVYKAKHNVLTRLRHEIQILEGIEQE